MQLWSPVEATCRYFAVYQAFPYSRVLSKLHFRFVPDIFSCSPLSLFVLSLSPSAQTFIPLRELRPPLVSSVPSFPIPLSIPFDFSLRLLRLFRSALPPPSRGNSVTPLYTLTVDINKHLDYTVKAALTTSPDWKLEDSTIGATERFPASASSSPPSSHVSFNFALEPHTHPHSPCSPFPFACLSLSP